MITTKELIDELDICKTDMEACQRKLLPLCDDESAELLQTEIDGLMSALEEVESWLVNIIAKRIYPD